MVAIIKRPTNFRLPFKRSLSISSAISSVLLGFIVWWLCKFAFNNFILVGVAAGIVVVTELVIRRKNLRATWVSAIPFITGGAASAIIIALSSRALTQFGVAVIYAVWRWWRSANTKEAVSAAELLILLGVTFEAIFLAAAIWHTPGWACLIVLWLSAYGLVYEHLTTKGERLARVLAATWALIVAEVSWVFLTWMVTYVLPGSYIVVPQAALILTGLAYCFGGIYMSQRQQSLTRARLAEYLFIALLLVIIVVSSTPWRSSI